MSQTSRVNTKLNTKSILKTDYIPISLILGVEQASDPITGVVINKILVMTKDGRFTTHQFTIDHNGIHGAFEKIN